MIGNLPVFTAGQELRADDLNALAEEVRGLAVVLGSPAGRAHRARGGGGMEPWTMAGCVDDLGEGIDGCAGGWDNNDRACRRDDPEELAGSAGNVVPREYLVDHGATRQAGVARGQWACTEEVQWYSVEPGSEAPPAELPDGRQGGLRQAVWREEVGSDGEPHSVAVRMFAQVPLPLWHLRWGTAQVMDRQQEVVWPGAAWQSVLLRAVLWYQWMPQELNYIRRSWTWALRARLTPWGGLMYQSHCVRGKVQRGF